MRRILSLARECRSFHERLTVWPRPRCDGIPYLRSEMRAARQRRIHGNAAAMRGSASSTAASPAWT
jgi:hypothetical protein